MVGQVRVLCVDDQRDVADSTGAIFRLIGCDVRVCYDGPSALAVALAFRPHVCFLDLNMPGMAGDELAMKLREQAGAGPLFLVCTTAMDGEGDFRRTREAGFDLHFVKPADPTQLLGVLSRVAGP